MSTLVFIRPVDFGGMAIADVFSMTIGGFTREQVLYLNDANAPTLMNGFYTVDLHATNSDVRVYKWCYDQQSIGVALYTSALLVPAPMNASVTLPGGGGSLVHYPPPTPPPPGPPSIGIGWGPVVSSPPPFDTSTRHPPDYLDFMSEPACFCKSPSEHAKDCQYIIWKRGKK